MELSGKIIVVGGMGSGKSCLLLRFADGAWAPNTKATIGVDFKSRTIDVRGGNSIRMQVWDSSGQEEFSATAKSYFRQSCAALVVFDVTSRTSFVQLPKWIDAVREHVGNKEIVVCLIGTKCDLADARKVSRQEGEAFARERNLLYVECSSKTGEGVDFAFTSTASSIFRKVDQGLLSLDDASHGVRREDPNRTPTVGVKLRPPAVADHETTCCF